MMQHSCIDSMDVLYCDPLRSVWRSAHGSLKIMFERVSSFFVGKHCHSRGNYKQTKTLICPRPLVGQRGTRDNRFTGQMLIYWDLR